MKITKTAHTMSWACPHCGKYQTEITADGSGMMLVCHSCGKEA